MTGVQTCALPISDQRDFHHRWSDLPAVRPVQREPGQVIAQSVVAASKTVNASRLPHSVHGYFIAAGDIRQDLLFDVENLRDGRSFSARRVNVTQAEGSILTAIASFQETDQEGVEFAVPLPGSDFTST